jgi:hypothetical protein
MQKQKDLEQIHNSDPMVSYHDMRSFHDPNPVVLKQNSLKPKRIAKLEQYRAQKLKIEEEILFYTELLATELHDDERQAAITQLGRWQREKLNNYQNIYRHEKLVADPNFTSNRRKRSPNKKNNKAKKQIELRIVQLDEVTDKMRNDKSLFIMGCFSAGKYSWSERVHYRKGVLHFYNSHEVGNFCNYLIIPEKVITLD